MSFMILGTGSALPKTVVTNNDLRRFLDTSDEWIRTRTGIRRRHILQDESVTDLAVQAAQKAMQMAGVAAKNLDYILCPTLGGDTITPSLACMLQREIGAACPAFDLNAACSGFLYAFDVADAYFARGAEYILVVAAEGISRITDWTDRSTAVLFGDGAGAVVLAKGDAVKYLHLTAQGCPEPLCAPFPRGNYPGGQKGEGSYLRMDGGEVYRFAVSAVTSEIQKGLESTGLAPENVDYLLLHQANMRIMDAATGRLGIPKERCPANVADVGNMSAASIPVLLDECARKGLFQKEDMLVLCGFGGGFTTGTAIIRWPL